jgi:hypothetical protein
MMSLGLCPKCGTDRTEKAAYKLVIPDRIDQALNPNSPVADIRRGLRVRAIVCQECSYVELFYDPA